MKTFRAEKKTLKTHKILHTHMRGCACLRIYDVTDIISNHMTTNFAAPSTLVRELIFFVVKFITQLKLLSLLYTIGKERLEASVRMRTKKFGTGKKRCQTVNESFQFYFEEILNFRPVLSTTDQKVRNLILI